MTSVKCPQCGLVNWSTAANCKRCGLAVADGFEDSGMEQQQSYAPPAPAAYAQPVHNFNFDEEELLRKLNKDSKLFYFIGGLQMGLWFFVGNLLIVDGVLNIGLSFVANKGMLKTHGLIVPNFNCFIPRSTNNDGVFCVLIEFNT